MMATKVLFKKAHIFTLDEVAYLYVIYSYLLQQKHSLLYHSKRNNHFSKRHSICFYPLIIL